MKVLALGVGGKDFAESLLEGVEKVTLEAADLKPIHNDFDLLIAFHTLNRIPYPEAQTTLKNWVGALKPGGEILLIIPSLEWAAKQILHTETPSPALQAHLFGGQRNQREVLKGAYTLLQVRDMCQQAGIKITHVTTGLSDISGHEVEIHSLRGVK